MVYAFTLDKEDPPFFLKSGFLPVKTLRDIARFSLRLFVIKQAPANCFYVKFW